MGLDAEGKQLPTSYVVAGASITQHVDLENAAYPVVADPAIRPGLTGVNYIYNRRETRRLQRQLYLGDGAATGIGTYVCSSIPHPAAKAACAAGIAVSWSYTKREINYAADHGQCLNFFIPYGAPARPLTIRRYTGPYCN
jgi:hypothetical protein